MEVQYHFKRSIAKYDKMAERFPQYKLAPCSLYSSSCELCVGLSCDVSGSRAMRDVFAFVRSVTHLLYLCVFCGQISDPATITQFGVK